MSRADEFGGRIERMLSRSVAHWPEHPVSAENAPNIVIVLLDDVGFAQLGCYGSSIRTPNLDALAAGGVRYANFHTTALCSPTRASLLTGRNPHSVGFGTIVERAVGYPGYNALLPPDAATVSTILRANSYTTWALGKWHLTPSYETGPAGPFDRWPIGQGFDRFYGFLGGSTDQYHPSLVRDNTPAAVPDLGRPYHLTEDLADTAIAWIRELTAVAPRRRFMLYLATGAGHAPHQVPREWIERYEGAFDHGWDAERHLIFERQRRLGIVPPTTALSDPNPGVQSWSALSKDEQTAFARMMEVYAAFISHTDAQIGRVFEFLRHAGLFDNTLIVALSDNGASADGGPHGTLSEGLLHNNMRQDIQDVLRHLDELGGPRFYNNYSWGWAQAGNTPFKWYKQFTHAGGITDPCIISWPLGSTLRGVIDHDYHHVSDLAPTLLDVAGIDEPESVNNIPQRPMHGRSMRYTLSGAVGIPRAAQHYECYGNRAIWHDGWVAVCRLQPDAPGGWPAAPPRGEIDAIPWELYHVAEDPAETRDLAASEPDRLNQLIERWWQAAEAYDVLPLDPRLRHERWSPQPLPPGTDTSRYVFHGPCGPFERGVSPNLNTSSYQLSAEIAVSTDCPQPQGVLLSIGSHHGGYVWYVRGNEVHFSVNLMVETFDISAALQLSPGHHVLGAEMVRTADGGGLMTFTHNGESIGSGRLERTLLIYPLGSGRTEVGSDSDPTVSDAYTAPFAFEGELLRLTASLASDNQPTDEHDAALHAQ